MESSRLGMLGRMSHHIYAAACVFVTAPGNSQVVSDRTRYVSLMKVHCGPPSQLSALVSGLPLHYHSLRNCRRQAVAIATRFSPLSPKELIVIIRKLGANGLVTSALGLGCMGMSDLYGPPPDRLESIATIHAALDAGVNLLDTGDFYGMGHNEMLIAEALKGRPREKVIISVKFGAQRDPAGNWIGIDARPSAVKTCLAYTLKRLGTDYVDIYRPARLDPNTPIEDTIGAMSDMVKAGYIRQIGLSEVSAATIRRAAAVHPISDLQIEYSLVSRSIEETILPTCRALGVGVTAYGVLSRGLISGHWSKEKKFGPHDFRAHIPRFRADNIDRNLALVEGIKSIADARGATVAQIAIAWVLSQGDDIVPLIGARRRDHLAEALAGHTPTLTADELAALEMAVPKNAASGTRYAEAQMAHLDSER